MKKGGLRSLYKNILDFQTHALGLKPGHMRDGEDLFKGYQQKTVVPDLSVESRWRQKFDMPLK